MHKTTIVRKMVNKVTIASIMVNTMTSVHVSYLYIVMVATPLGTVLFVVLHIVTVVVALHISFKIKPTHPVDTVVSSSLIAMAVLHVGKSAAVANRLDTLLMYASQRIENRGDPSSFQIVMMITVYQETDLHSPS